MDTVQHGTDVPALVLGIDQGGTKTMAAISDLQGNLLGSGSAGGGYHAVNGMDHAMGEVLRAVKAALANANLDMPLRFRMIGAGLTGADFDYEFALLHAALEKTLMAETILIRNDCMVAWRGGATLPHGAVLCAGTGVNCGVRSPEGDEFIFGYYVRDENQGGGSLGRQSLWAVFDAHVGLTPNTLLTERVLAHYHEKTVDSLIHSWVMSKIPHDGVKHLALVLDECVELGDPVSIGIQEKFGTSLAHYPVTGLQRFGLQEKKTEVVLSGSIFKSRTPTLRNAVEAGIRKYVPYVRIVEARYEPVVGGVLTALDTLAGGFVTNLTVLRNIEASAKRLNLIRMPV